MSPLGGVPSKLLLDAKLWMQRLPEPELMVDPAQVLAYAAADFSGGDQHLSIGSGSVVFDSGRATSDPAVILDLGCGPKTSACRLPNGFLNRR